MNIELTNLQRTIIGVFLLAILGAVIGWVYEMLFYRIDQGRFITRGHGFGPWLPIYAFGALGLTIMVLNKELNLIQLFIFSVIGSGVLEYATGWVLYNCFGGVRLWDYNVEIWNWGNINGYVCARSVLVFGVFGCIFGALIVPKFMDVVANANANILVAVSSVLAIVVGADVIYGYIIKSFINGGL